MCGRVWQTDALGGFLGLLSASYLLTKFWIIRRLEKRMSDRDSLMPSLGLCAMRDGGVGGAAICARLQRK